MQTPFLSMNQVYKHYDTPAGPLQVLKGIDLRLNPGDFAAIIGQSGVGKTTLLNMITGVDRPTEGDVWIDGLALHTIPSRKVVKWRAKTMGIVFQFFQLLPTITVSDNVVFPMDYAKVYEPSWRRDIALQLLEQLEIGDQAAKTPDMLSGGQQQRAAIARALANNPPLIIGDEPTANLDRMSTENVFNVFRASAERGACILITTYDRDLVKNIPLVYELKEGCLYLIKDDRRPDGLPYANSTSLMS